jgi:hypothetical protein
MFGGCWFYEWRSNGKTQYKNDFNTETGQAMHREVRASLTSVSDLSLSVSRRKT